MKAKVISRPKDFVFPPADKAEHAAIKAMCQGAATPDQQVRFYDWVVKKAGMIGGISFEPDNERMTHFNEGRRYIAAAVVYYTTEPIEKKGPHVL